jgi:hypothetical protein
MFSYGGSISGEHGDGQSKAEFLYKMFGTELIEAFRESKTIWDPDWKMNPGKIVDPYHIDENLRLGANYHPWDPPTYFKFPTIMAASRTLRYAAWALESAAAKMARAHRTRCARVTWSLAKRCIRHVAGRTCFGKCCMAMSSVTGGTMST